MHIQTSSSFHIHAAHRGRVGLLLRLKLCQLRLCPFRKELVIQHTDKLAAIPACHLPVAKAGAAHRAANGVRRTAKTVMGIPELVFLTPAGFFQRVGAEYQHLSGIVLLGAVTDTMLRAKEI